jgi:hypothetical protein
MVTVLLFWAKGCALIATWPAARRMETSDEGSNIKPGDGQKRAVLPFF